LKCARMNIAMKRIKSGLAFIFLLSLTFAHLSSFAKEDPGEAPKLIVFHSPGCHNCLRIEKEIMPVIEKEFKDKVTIEYRDIDNMENYRLMLGLEEKHQSKVSNIMPVFYFQGRFLNGQGDVKKDLESLLAASSAALNPAGEALPKIDLVQRFKKFTPLAIIAVGLIDGINPCAVTVIVFFMSFLSFQGYRKREIIVIGMLFILSVYLTYCLIGLGIFQSLYKLQGFWLLTKIINITVGIISISFSIYALYDFIQYKKTKATDDLLLSLPQSIKNQIHKVIGSQYRVHTVARQPGFRRPLLGLAISALITGFLVSVLEAVCVAKIYLPTIIFVLKTTSLKLKALVYLLLYNLLFVVPLLAIFFFALAGTTSEKFQNILKGNLGTIKILMGIMFLVLGIFLIWRA
jgi:cytochrome c biogenesis protein CcdA